MRTDRHIGTRGIPNEYGGFEQFAAYLSKGLVDKGHEVSVYSSHKHSYREHEWNGVNIIHCYDPEYLIGTVGQFIYDLNCTLDARKKKFDILLVLGYTSSSVWGRLYPAKTIVITNMDGWEWKRSKYSKPVRKFLRYAEKLAVQFSDHHVADALPIKEYLDHKYRIRSNYISYGAETPLVANENILNEYGLLKNTYMLLIARMEPENNIEMILDGLCENQQPVLVIGGVENKYGKKMKAKFTKYLNIHFIGTIYDAMSLHTLKANCFIYFHGHSVGGTNPSLLEAMASSALVAAHDNVFNRAVLQENSFYFSTVAEVSQIAANARKDEMAGEMIRQNLQKIQDNHSWQKIVTEYEALFIQSYQAGK